MWTGHRVMGQRQRVHPTHARTQLRLHPVLERRATHSPHEVHTGLKGTGSRRKGSGRRAVLAWGNQAGFSREVAGEPTWRAEPDAERRVPASYQMRVGIGHSFPAPELAKGSEPPASVNSSVKWGLTPPPRGTGVL